MAPSQSQTQQFDAEVKNSEIPVVVDFWAEWWRPVSIGPAGGILPPRWMAGKDRQRSTVDEIPTARPDGSACSGHPCSHVKNGEVVSHLAGAAKWRHCKAGSKSRFKLPHRSKHIIWRVRQSLARYFLISLRTDHIGEASMFPEWVQSVKSAPALGIAPWINRGGHKGCSLKTAPMRRGVTA